MTEKRSDKPHTEDEPQRTPPEREPGEATTPPEPGTGGVSQAEYDEAVDKAAKGVQG